MRVEKLEIRLAMLGMIEGNGHPYSGSAIVNDCNLEQMTRCSFLGGVWKKILSKERGRFRLLV